MDYYNCYAYVMNWHNDGYLQPGQKNNIIINIDTVTPFELALITKLDLQNFFNKRCVIITTVLPTVQSLGWMQDAICVRKGYGNGRYDYHYMRLNRNGRWYHKPDGTAVLSYDYQPVNSRPWTNEALAAGFDYCEPNITYDSEIYYIIYQESHNSTYRFTGNHYHSGGMHFYEYAYICDICHEAYGNVWESTICSGPPCYVPFSLNEEGEIS